MNAFYTRVHKLRAYSRESAAQNHAASAYRNTEKREKHEDELKHHKLVQCSPPAFTCHIAFWNPTATNTTYDNKRWDHLRKVAAV